LLKSQSGLLDSKDEGNILLDGFLAWIGEVGEFVLGGAEVENCLNGRRES